MTTSITPPCITVYIICHTPMGPRYLLIRRCCGDYLNGTWQMVTGSTKEGETAIQTALREIQEETGIVPTKFYSADAVESFFVHSRNLIIFVPVFVAIVEEMSVQLCAEEHDAYEWLYFEEAKERLVWSEQKRILSHIHDLFVIKKPNALLFIKT